MAGKKGSYSNIVIYDERRRYYYLWSQKNRPLLDDEIRSMGIGLLDQVRRSVQNIYGDVASPYQEYSGFYSTTDAFKVEQATDTNKNFVVKGGASLDHPAVLYAKGFYLFLTGDLEYKHQTYTSENVDINTASEKDKTISNIPAMSTPAVDRTDIVYVDLHFEEVSSVQGTDDDVYRDSGLKNPIVGTDTANRLRAVIDVRIKENWTDPINENIFTHNEFLGGITGNDSYPTDNHYKIPIAVIYREAYRDTVLSGDIIDLLSLYNKRVFSLEEMTYRTRHGGYVQTDVDELGYTGFQGQFPGAKVDEGAFATGLNKGLGTRAFDSNSVTPRVIDNTGRFFMGSLMVGHDTGLIALETGPTALHDGEVIVKDLSARSIYVGFGETGVTGMREYEDTVKIVSRGETGKTIFDVRNIEGQTGSMTMVAGAVHGGRMENYFSMDHRGRIGVNTMVPGWSGPDSYWNLDRYNDGLRGETGVNVAADVNASARVGHHLFVDKDAFFGRDAYGRTWHIPEAISDQKPALFGFTGIPQDHGLTGMISNMFVRRGIGLLGETGLEAYGYTGGMLGYEAFDEKGQRIFTIGDLGKEFDRAVMSLYGTGARKAFLSSKSFLDISSAYGQLQSGDTVKYDIELADSSHITGTVPITTSGLDAVEELRWAVLEDTGFGAVQFTEDGHGVCYGREFTYTYYDENGDTSTQVGRDYGVQIIEDPFGFSLGFDNHGRIVLKEIPEDPINVEIENVSFTVSRTLLSPVTISFTTTHYYGSTSYGGNIANIKFAKFDLGEGADGWLFNGDVYFNGDGLFNKVVFSPNAIFRDDVFIYGSVFADEMVFNFANIHNIQVRNNLFVGNRAYVDDGIAAGPDVQGDFDTLKASDSDLMLYIKEKGMMREILLRGLDEDALRTGNVYFTTIRDANAYAYIGGILGSATEPFGMHIIDKRTGVEDDDRIKEYVIDFSDGSGNYRNGTLTIQGDLRTERYFTANFLGVGDIDTINTDYKFQCNGRALVNDVLEVKALRFVGAEAPEGSDTMWDPVNITTIGKINESDTGNAEYYENNEIILREKKFTATERIYLDNNDKLVKDLTSSGMQNYYEKAIKLWYDDPTGDKYARWAFDTDSYLESQFNEIVANGDTTENEIVVEDVTEEKYKKFKCERVRVASLGKLIIEWSGFKYTGSSTPTANPIQTYYFTSEFFRNRDGGINIDWFAEGDRFGDDNLIVRVTADFVDTNPDHPTIYKVDKSLGIYIPKSAWYWYYDDKPDANGYRSFSLFYPYEETTDTFNILSFDKQTSYADDFGDPGWKLAIYPRLIKQTRVPVGTNLDKLYRGEWSMDVVLVPERTGRVANLVGKSYISYMQS